MEVPLRRINIAFLPNLLHADFHAVFCNDDILLLHLLRGLVRDVICDRVDDVGYEAEDADDGEEDEERSERVHIVMRLRDVVMGRWEKGPGSSSDDDERASVVQPREMVDLGEESSLRLDSSGSLAAEASCSN